MPCYEYRGLRPIVDESAYVHPTAVLIGDVVVGRDCFIGPGASLRGDIGQLVMKNGANVQDNCILHCFPGKSVVIEEGGHVGHGAVLHSCAIRRNAMVGMLSIVMDDAVVGEEAMVAAMTLVIAEMEVPPRTLIAGIPGKVKRELSSDEIRWKTGGTTIYQDMTTYYRETCREVEALREAEAKRPVLPLYDYPNKHEM